jgi:hypothetical protein
MKSVKFYQYFCRFCKRNMLFAPTGKFGRTISNKHGEFYECTGGHVILLVKLEDKVICED